VGHFETRHEPNRLIILIRDAQVMIQLCQEMLNPLRIYLVAEEVTCRRIGHSGVAEVRYDRGP
jgi:hypothetical protein